MKRLLLAVLAALALSGCLLDDECWDCGYDDDYDDGDYFSAAPSTGPLSATVSDPAR